MTGGAFDDNQIRKMEFEMLHLLDFELNIPTAYDFLETFLELIGSSLRNELSDEYAYYSLELQIFSPDLLRFEPSVRAFASLLRGYQEFEGPTQFPAPEILIAQLGYSLMDDLVV